MQEVAFWSFLIDLFYAVVASLVVFYGLRYLDKRSGRKWSETIGIIREDPVGSAIYHGARILALCLFFGMLLGCATANAAMIPDRYDSQIRAATDRWWPRTETADWRYWKAQLYQESLMNPDAVSHVGARGLAQFMPATWAEVTRQLGLGDVSPHVAKHAINAGAYYMLRQYSMWTSKRPDIDRWDLARACYNAGAGNMLAAQKAAGGAALYIFIIQALPQVTGDHARETTTYVNRIHRWYRGLRCSHG